MSSGMRAFVALLQLMLLAGCATVDQFGPRTAEYSRQVESAHNQELLLNVLRAAYRQPMHFVSISNITGSASATGEIGFSVPIGGSHGGAPGNPAQLVYSAAPKFSYTAGPTVVTVGVLNTQEFYQGLLAPLKESEIALFIKQGVPKWLLMTLFVEEIKVHKGSSVTSLLNNFHLDPRTGRSRYAGFKTQLDELIADGLDMEPRSSDEVVGPAVAASAAMDPKRILEAKAQGLELARFDVKPSCENERRCRTPSQLTPDEQAALGQSQVFYHLVKRVDVFAFCFRDAQGACREVSEVTPKQTPTLLERVLSVSKAKGETYDFRTRSVEEIIYFLGEVARYQLCLMPTEWPQCGTQAPRVMVRVVAGTEAKGEAELFKMTSEDAFLGSTWSCMQLARAPGIAVAYADKCFVVASSTGGEDRSGQVLQIVTELLSLKKSAKDFPTPSIIPVLAR